MDTSKDGAKLERKLHAKKGFTLFWLVPLAAVAIAVYLFYQTIHEQGTMLEITFKNARGLIADKTELHYHGVKVGVVKHLALSSDFKDVLVQVQLDRSADSLAKAGSQFWIVYPEIGIGGISGLDTIIGGNYIRVQEGDGPPATKFAGLEAPPTSDPNSPDLFVTLTAQKMPSVAMDSPIIFRQLEVGKVEDLRYDINEHHAVIDIRIYAKYKDLVRKATHFWNTSGLDVSVGLNGVTVKSKSLSSIIFGSISMGIPDEMLTSSPLAENGATFDLFDTVDQVIAKEAETINKSSLWMGRVLTLHLKDSQGIEPQRTEMRYRGVKVGTVVSVSLTPDNDGVLAKVLLSSQAQGLAQANSKIILVWPQLKVQDLSRIQVAPDVTQGPYFRIEPGDGGPCDDYKVVESDNDSYHPIDGLVVALRASRVGTLHPGAPIYYRGITVGQVEKSGLAPDGSAVLIRGVIQPKFAPLVRANTRFWNSSGIVSDVNIWGGVKVNTQPFADSMSGSVSLATPDNAQMGNKVSSGTTFKLEEKSDEAWLKWAPTIPLDL